MSNQIETVLGQQIGKETNNQPVDEAPIEQDLSANVSFTIKRFTDSLLRVPWTFWYEIKEKNLLFIFHIYVPLELSLL